MNHATIYGVCLAAALAVGAALTHGQTQRTLLVATVCALAAQLVATTVTLAGERAQRRAREADRAHYGQEPPAA